MTNPYRALCAELIEAVLSDDSHIDCRQIARRARALLAEQPVSPPYKLPEPEAEGPTDEELEAIELALWDKYRTKGWGGSEFMYDNNFSYALEEYRTVLARWGRPTPQPPADGEVGA